MSKLSYSMSFFEKQYTINEDLINQLTHETITINYIRGMAFTRVLHPKGRIQDYSPSFLSFTSELSQDLRVIEIPKDRLNHSRWRKHQRSIKTKKLNEKIRKE